jgi:hypothetical protein
MFLVDPNVFRFVVKGVKAIFVGVQRRQVEGLSNTVIKTEYTVKDFQILHKF